MCYSSEPFRRVASIIYFIYDSINCPTTVSEGGGGRLISRSFSMLGTLDFLHVLYQVQSIGLATVMFYD